MVASLERTWTSGIFGVSVRHKQNVLQMLIVGSVPIDHGSLEASRYMIVLC